MSAKKTSVGVIGATGYTGAELLRLLQGHPSAEAVLATSTREAGTPVSRLYPALTGSALAYEPLDAAAAKSRCDGFFICAPHGVAMDLVAQLLDDQHWVIDLSADFRLADADTYEAWYGHPHRASDLLAEAAYGLPELFVEKIDGARLVANPGCYPTATLLALAPAVASGLVEMDSLIVDAKSGVSGAGREPSPGTVFSECAESVAAYKVATHRHTPEIEQALAWLASGSGAGAAVGEASGSDATGAVGEAAPVTISFTPHLVPMARGLLATCYGALTREVGADAVVELYRRHYADAPFVHVLGAGVMPATKHVTGSNACHIGLVVDSRTGRLIVTSAIDNLVKGASGQAVQNMNVLLGLDQTTGLTAIGRVV